MQSNEQTQMTNAPAQTQMTSPPVAQEKLVKIRAIYPIRRKGADGFEEIIPQGSVAEVSESDAKEFCDKEYELGHRNQFGHFEPQSSAPFKAKRAERI